MPNMMDAMIANSLIPKPHDGEFTSRKELHNLLANDEQGTERSNKVDGDTMRMESKLQHAILDLGQNEIEIAAKPPKIIVREKSNKNLSNIMY